MHFELSAFRTPTSATRLCHTEEIFQYMTISGAVVIEQSSYTDKTTYFYKWKKNIDLGDGIALMRKDVILDTFTMNIVCYCCGRYPWQRSEYLLCKWLVLHWFVVALLCESVWGDQMFNWLILCGHSCVFLQFVLLMFVLIWDEQLSSHAKSVFHIWH